ncbi:MAG TPA: 7-cyano-7-deazaguanine synthase [Gaiellaceae bacterium]
MRHDGVIGVRISERRIARGFKGSLSPRVCDLLDIAGAVYRQDRLERRERPRRRTFGGSQQRELMVEVAVRDPEFWRDSPADQQLRDALDWLTGDRWQFTFVRFTGERSPAEREQQLLSEVMDAGGQIALFSGGLDALAGASMLLEHDPACRLVAIGTNPRQIRCQVTLMRELRRLAPGLVAIPIHAGLTGATRATQERSQRSRAFLFLTIAIAAAHAGGAETINMCENGIGAMNLPYSERQIGVDTSRAAHPETLYRMSVLAETVLERAIVVRNPLFSFTKAEACRALPAEWLPLVSMTVSCDIGFTDRRKGPSLCGVCSSCLLRRHALHAAGLRDIDLAEPYRFDLLRGGDAADAEAFRAMHAQAARLSGAFTSWPALLAAFPDVERVSAGLLRAGVARSDLQAEATIIRLLAAYVGEWQHFPARAGEAVQPAEAPLALSEAV